MNWLVLHEFEDNLMTQLLFYAILEELIMNDYFIESLIDGYIFHSVFIFILI